MKEVHPVPEMTLEAVEDFLDLMDALGVRVWLDGGWAVDACLGQQTRRHNDLDIVIEDGDASVVVSALRACGYREVPREDTSDWNFVLADDAGHEIDFHVVVFDENGDGIFGSPPNGVRCPAEALSGTGTIAGRSVACISPEWLVRFHTGYDVDETDWADVSALCQRFGIPLPDDYRGFGDPAPALQEQWVPDREDARYDREHSGVDGPATSQRGRKR